MDGLSDHASALPEAETQFKEWLEEWFVRQGVPRSDALFDTWVAADGPSGYWAGLRIVREIEMLAPIAGKRILDVGSGFGGFEVCAWYAGAECVGIEIGEQRLRASKKRLELHGHPSNIILGDAFHLPFEDEQFDVAVSSEVLEHVKHRGALIGEMARVLRKGGVLYLAFPNLLSLQNVIRDPHYRLFGATLLPISLAQLYTKAVRKRSYDVEVLPFVPHVKHLCARHGIHVFSLNTSEQVVLERIDSPGTIRHPLGKYVISPLRAVGLGALLKTGVRVRAAFGDHVALAGIKGEG
jgi:ubiquinone/menaquinone biosynthesis C-methylase UbiE